MITLGEIKRAQRAIAPYVKRTNLEKSERLSNELETNIYLKLELFQRTGSFKPRGAFYQILQLTPEQRRRGVVGVSGGNFAIGMALAARELNTEAIVCMPASTPRIYVDAAERFGARIDFSSDIDQVFARAEQLRDDGWNLLHPFDDPFQMAGAGTIGLEIVDDLPEVSDVFISIGGGGLYTGIAVAIAGLKTDVRIWGVESEGSESMGESLRTGKGIPARRRSPLSCATTATQRGC